MDRRRLVMALAFAAALPRIARAESKPHRLLLQISDTDPAKMREVLDVAANVSRYYSGLNQEVEVAVVAFGAGIEMLLANRSPVEERLANYFKALPDVAFKACGNTLRTLAAKEGAEPPVMKGVEIVPVGVAAILEMAEQGWTVVRP